MLGLRWPELRTVLAIGAHSDDIEIGAGATLLRLVREHPGARIVWVVLAAGGRRGEEARASAGRFLAGAGAAEVLLEGFRDGYFPQHWGAIKERFETLKRFEPDLVLTHYGRDLHQDHRVVAELTWNTFRDHLILEYEVPKWDGDLDQANAYMALPAAVLERKVELLLGNFGTQRSKDWFDADTFRGLARLRGMECRAPERYAEAFVLRKARLG